jgi:hypothetical protein
MSEQDPIVAVLDDLDRPASPRPEFAEALRAQLLAELAEPNGAVSERGVLGKPLGLHRRRRVRRPGLAIALVTAVIALAVAAAAAVLAGLGSAPASAEALLRRAERQLAAAPPFRAVIVSREVVSADHIRRNWTYTDAVLYGGKNRWRRNVLSDSLSPNSPFYSMTGTGSFFVWDGRYLGISRADKRFELYPGLLGTDRNHDSYFVFAELSPSPPFPPLGSVTHRYLTQACTKVLPDTTIIGRRAHHLGCGTGPSHFELWLDAQTGFVLKRVGPRGARMEVRSIEYSPVFQKSAFRVVPPARATIVWTGPGAPPSTFSPTKGD